MTINEILASGRYLDRRGRGWHHDGLIDSWVERPTASSLREGIVVMGHVINEAQMRLLIERDQHRDVCPGLRWCLTHPVVNVGRNRLSKSWQVWGPGDWYRTSLGAFPEAMGAARALAVEP